MRPTVELAVVAPTANAPLITALPDVTKEFVVDPVIIRDPVIEVSPITIISGFGDPETISDPVMVNPPVKFPLPDTSRT